LTLGFKLFRRVSTLLRQYGISFEEFVIALGVLRMIKLFGWEHKMSEAIKQKRDEELVWIWKDKVK
jgi:hypothetical protein